jgi:hypothetical protein
MGIVMMSGITQAEVVNDFSDISSFTTTSSWPVTSTSVTLTQDDNSFLMEYSYQSWETVWYATPAAAVWALEPYNFSGKGLSIEARSDYNVGRAWVELYSNGTLVWSTSITAISSSWTTIGGIVPEGSAYESIDEIRFWMTCGTGGGGTPGFGEAGGLFRNLTTYSCASAPVFSPAGPYISGPTGVTISCATTGASIYYTLNDGTPTTSSTPYVVGSTIPVKHGDTLKAIAVASGYHDSNVTSQTYTTDLVNTFSNISGFTKSSDWPVDSGSVTLTQLTNSFQIDFAYQSWDSTWFATPAYAIWTLDNACSFSGRSVSVEAESISNIGSASIQLYSNGTCVWSTSSSIGSSWTTVRGSVPEGSAYASIDHVRFCVTCGAGAANPGSGNGSAAFRNFVSTMHTAAPVFSPAGPTISGPTEVTISCATEGASIYYTLNDGTPTTSSIPYVAGSKIPVKDGDKLQAIAVKNGYIDSDVTCQTYTTELVNDFSNISGFATTSGWPVTSVSLTQLTDSFQMNLIYQSWDTPWLTTPVYAIWTLAEPYNFSGKSLSVEAMSVQYIGRASIELYSQGVCVWSALYPEIGSSWTTIGGTVPEGAVYESVDKIRFYMSAGAGAPNPGTETGIGMFRNFKTFDQTAKPVFSSAGPYITGPTDVTMTCATEGSSIYYTLNGQTPTTSDTRYTTGSIITVNEGTRLKAMAVADGFSPSYTSMTYVLKTIPVIAWGGILGSQTVERFQQMRQCGFTHAVQFGYSMPADALAALDNARDGGIQLIVGNPTAMAGWPEINTHPALAGYYMDDEPTADKFAALAAQVQTVKSCDPTHTCLTNLLPLAAFSNASEYNTYVNGFMNTVTPCEILSYDTYPIKTSGIHSDFYQNLEIISAKAKAAGIPFRAFVLSTAHGDYPIPTLPHLRFQAFSNLAYGAQGLEYFTYWNYVTDLNNPTYFHDSPIDADGNKTATWYTVQDMNREIKGLSPVFLGSSVVSVGHTGSSKPTGTTWYTAMSPITSLTTSGSDGAVVSHLVNGDNHYLVVVNRDIDSTMTLTISVNTSVNFSEVSKNGTKTPLTSGTVSYSVAPADIVVLNWGTPTLAVSPASRAVTADAGTTTFAVSNNGGSAMSWSAQVISGSSWASITSGSSGTNSGTISLSYAANTSTASRTATIRITATGAACSPTDVTIVQAAASTPGDFNGDGLVNATDIDLLSAAINSHSTSYATYDLTKDGKINSADMDYLITTILHTYYGDADLNHSVGVSDLSVLAAYYNTPSGASWANGDFDGNGAVGVSDLSILAANYNSGSASTVSWAEAYAQAFGTTSDAETSSDGATADEEDTGSTVCSSLGLSLIAGLALMGLMIVKLED